MRRDEAAERLASAARRLWSRGWVEATSGNLSVPLEGGVLVTATGCDKGTISPSDVVLVDRESGEPREGEVLRPSYETKIHLRLYAKTGAGAVIHAHPPHAVALSTAVRDAIEVRGLELVKAFSGVGDPSTPVLIPVVENHQDMDRMSRDCAAAVRAPVPAVVLRGHGVTTWGRDLEEAVRHLEAVEGLSRIVCLQTMLGVR